MQENCDVCGRTDGRLQHRIVHLARPAAEREADHGELSLCRGCAKRRTVRSWDRHEAQGKGILEALQWHPLPKERHYEYLIEDHRHLRLMRLRPDWIEARAHPSADVSLFPSTP
jgi:hypothetical protein